MARADDIGALLVQQFPGARVTSTVRSRAEQDALVARGATKARNSQHLTGNGLDIVLPRGVSPSQVRSFLNTRGIDPGEFLNERGGQGQGTGAHLHIGLAPRANRPAPAKGGDQASTGGGTSFDRARASRQQSAGPDMAAVHRAYLNTGKPGGMTAADAAQYENAILDGHAMLPRGQTLRVKPAAPLLPKGVVEAFNSHRMDDDPEARAEIKRAVDAGEVSLPRGMRLQAPAPRSFGELLGMGTRPILEGAGGLVDIVAGPINGLVNALPGQQGLSTTPFRDAGAAASDALGFAKPESDTEQLNAAVIEGGTQGLVTAGLGAAASPVAGATGAIGKALAASPVLDTISGATSGAAQETARQAGAGPVAQVVAGLAGGFAPVGLAAAGERAASRVRAPKSLPEVVETVPRAAVVDEAGNLTPEGQELAARHNVTPEQVVQAYEAPPKVREATANDQMPESSARQATTGEQVIDEVPVREAPQADTELPPQPNAPNTDQPSPTAPDALPATALARVEQAGQFGVDMSRGQATKNFDVQEAESRLRNSNGPEAEQMRQFIAKQTEQVKSAVDEFRSAFGDANLTAEQRGAAVQEAVRELRDNGQKGVSALYTAARELGQEVPLDTAGIRNAYDRLMVEADVPESVKSVLTQEAARYGIIGKAQEIAPGNVTAENGITRYKLDSGETRAVYGPPETLRLDNAEAFRQAVSKQYQADGGQKLTQILRAAIDDATEEAATKLAQYGQDGAKVPNALKAAREAHQTQVKTFKAKDIVQSIADWKKGTNTDVLKPEQVMQQALAKTSDLKRVKAVLLSKPTVQSKAAWRAIQAHGLAEVFSKATQRNANVGGEITEAISGSKLRSAIETFGPDKLKVLLDADEFNKLMKLRRVIEDVTIPITGTTNPSGSGNLLMRLAKDVDNQVTAAFSAAGMALGGPAGAAIGGAAGRTISPAIKDAKQIRVNAETLKGATEYTPEAAAGDTGAPKPTTASKAGSAVKQAGASTVKAFIETYGSPRILAPVLAATTGAQDQ
jgi:hypothetical protein